MVKKDTYLEDGEEEAQKCENYDSLCRCIDGMICYVFGKKIHKAKNCNQFKPVKSKI